MMGAGIILLAQVLGSTSDSSRLAQILNPVYDSIPRPEVFAQALAAITDKESADSRILVNLESFKRLTRSRADSNRNWSALVKPEMAPKVTVADKVPCPTCKWINAVSVGWTDSLIEVRLSVSTPHPPSKDVSSIHWLVELVPEKDGLRVRSTRVAALATGFRK